MRGSILLYIVGSVCIEFGRRLYPRHQLLIFQSDEFFTRITAYDAIWHKLLTLVVFGHLITVGDVTFGSKVCVQTTLCKDDRNFLGVIGIIGLYSHIVDLRSYAKGSV